MQLRPDVDLISLSSTRRRAWTMTATSLKDNAKAIGQRFKAAISSRQLHRHGADCRRADPQSGPTYKSRLIGNRPGGNRNSYWRLGSTAANKAREKFKRPAIVLMTDAVPNDGMPGSASNTTMNQAADALNAANAELHVWAAFDLSGISIQRLGGDDDTLSRPGSTGRKPAARFTSLSATTLIRTG